MAVPKHTLPDIADFADMGRHADQAASLLKALAHPGRLLVMCRLVEGEASVSELQALGSLSMSALSQHLGVMKAAGLVATRRESQLIFYSLVQGPALGVLQVLHDAYCKSRPPVCAPQVLPRKSKR